MGTLDSNVNVNDLLNQVIDIVSPGISNMPTATEQQLRDVLRSMRGKPNVINTPPKPIKSTAPSLTSEAPPVSTGFQNPIKGTYYCTGIFGQGDARHKGVHNGADLRAAGGTSVYPITEGTVTSVTGGGKGGNVVVIQHANKITSRYAHLGTVSVHPGDSVDKNTVIATVGASGNAKNTAPHIHLEIKENGQFVNPNKYVYVPPYSDLQPEEKGNLWLSEEAKKNAHSFNMNEHLANKRIAFTDMINKIEKVASAYCKFTSNYDMPDETRKSAEQLALANMYPGVIICKSEVNPIVVSWKDEPNHPIGIWLTLSNGEDIWATLPSKFGIEKKGFEYFEKIINGLPRI